MQSPLRICVLILKKVFFNELELLVFDSVYEPREDSFLLANSLPKIQGLEVLDIGCGTGIQSINASQKGAKSVLAIDINPQAIENTKQNCTAQKIGNVSAMESNLFEKIPQKFDVIIFNPPYLPSEPTVPIPPFKSDEIKEPELDGGKNGFEIIKEFIIRTGEHLKPKGMVFFLASSLNNFQELEKLLAKKGFGFEIAAQEKFFFEELRVYKFIKNNSKAL